MSQTAAEYFPTRQGRQEPRNLKATQQGARRFLLRTALLIVAALSGSVLLADTAVPSAEAVTLSEGDVVVIDSRGGTNFRGALFHVNPTNGQRTVISDFGDPLKGELGRLALAVAFDEDGILVLDRHAGTNCPSQLILTFGCGALFRVDPATGVRTVLSDFGDMGKGPTGVALQDLTVDAAGNILVTDQAAGGGRGLLFVVNPVTGIRSVLSNFALPGQGPLGGNPSGVAVEPGGRILVADPGVAPAVLFAIDPATGNRTILRTRATPSLRAASKTTSLRSDSRSAEGSCPSARSEDSR